MSNLGPAWWLLFVEDPGAINYFVPLVEDLENGGLPYRICAEGHAVTLLEKKGIIPFQGFPKSIIDGSGNPSLIVVGTSENPDTLAFDYIVWGR